MKYYKKSAIAITITSLFSMLVACSPSSAQENTSASSSPAETAAITVAATEQSIPERLTALGFYVFPEPVPIPAFTVPALDGSILDSTKLTGKITLLNFWATWCPPCKREMPSIQRLHEAMQGEKFSIAAISTGETRATVVDFLKTNAYTFPIFLDEKGTLGAAFASQGIPSTYILDLEGKVIAGIVGSRDYDDTLLIALLKELSRQ